MTFREHIFQKVKAIPRGSFRTYKEIGGKAARAVGNILALSRDLPCHRVIRSDYLVGGYKKRRDLDWLKAALLLKEGAIGVIPTDTIYGICTSAFIRKSVEKIYALRKRNPNKPCIILISDLSDLKKFGVFLNPFERKILSKIWPSSISVVLRLDLPKFYYLHRGTNSLAFRLPKSKFIRKILTISGALVAPSANWEGYPPATTIAMAKRYFGKNVFYLDRGKIISQPSTLIALKGKNIEVLRKGRDFRKIYALRLFSGLKNL
jgi:L-threonylcarbamoyladenylate synthase